MNDAQENLIEDERIPIGGWGSFKVVTKIDDTGDMSIQRVPTEDDVEQATNYLSYLKKEFLK